MFKNGYYYSAEPKLKNNPSLTHSSISIPGFRTLLDPNESKFQKSLWGLLMFIFLVLTLFQIGERIQNYLSYPVEQEYKFVSKYVLQFPSVTICPYDGFAGQTILGAMKNRSVDSVYDLLNFNDTNLNKIWNLTDIDFPSLVPNCVYGMARNHCSGHDSWRKQITVLGICHTFDSEPVQYAGLLTSFYMQIQGSDLNKWFPNSDSRRKNVIIAIHNKYDDITYKVIFDGFEASIGTFFLINYIHNVNIYENITGKPCHTPKYYKRCQLGCYDSFAQKGSFCRLPFMKTSMKPLCHTSKAFRKAYPIPVQETLFFNGVDTCLAKCGQPCKREAYDENVETKSFINETFIRFQVNPLRAGTAITTEKMSYSIVALSCDIGAILGLYMGVSVLTITEFIELFMDFMTNKYSKRAQSTLPKT